LENRAGAKHETGVRVSGLPAGTYQVFVGDRAVPTFASDGVSEAKVLIPVDAATVAVRMARVAGATD
jgi:hypothetical protein